MSNRKETELSSKKLEEEILKQKDLCNAKTEKKDDKKSIPNRLNLKGNISATIDENQQIAEGAAAVYKQMLPSLLKSLSKIKDPRNPNSIKHKMTVLLMYGIIMFVLQLGSRRNTNREMNDIGFENLKTIFPELETLPHADTLARLLKRIDVNMIQDSMIELLKDLIKRKKFKNYLRKKHLLIAIDGTQKFFRDYQWAADDKGLVRHVGEDKAEQHYVYVLESVLILNNGIALPLLSIFLKKSDVKVTKENSSVEVFKQDCERTAFIRMADQIKKLFRNSRITIVADGLYACGPVIQICRTNKWDYMIVFKEGSIPSVWNDALGIMKLDTENRLKVFWGERLQYYAWANDIEYEYKSNNKSYRVNLNVVLCYEEWEEDHIRSTGVKELCKTRYAWISSVRLNHSNVFERCTKLGRYRWKIENNILKEKHQGYKYKHCYSYDWNAMEGYHYLMKIGEFLNALATNSEVLNSYVEQLGIQGYIKKLWSVCNTMLIDTLKIHDFVSNFKQWRLVPVC